MLRYVDPERAPELPPQKLEINPSHPILIQLEQVRHSNASLATLIIQQVFDSALVAAGLLDDGRSMLPRINQIINAALQTSQPPQPFNQQSKSKAKKEQKKEQQEGKEEKEGEKEGESSKN